MDAHENSEKTYGVQFRAADGTLRKPTDAHSGEASGRYSNFTSKTTRSAVSNVGTDKKQAIPVSSLNDIKCYGMDITFFVLRYH